MMKIEKESLVIQDKCDKYFCDIGINSQDSILLNVPKAIARRIVACWNACSELSTKLIEDGGFAAVPVITHRELKQKLISLILASERALDALNGADFIEQSEAADELRQAIKKASE